MLVYIQSTTATFKQNLVSWSIGSIKKVVTVINPIVHQFL